MALHLSTAFAPPIQYFSKLYAEQGTSVYIEACETYVKQSYRNRCHILSPNGLQALTIPVEHSKVARSTTRDLRISGHSDWRHLHLQALATAYGPSPFFEYYWDDLHALIIHPYTHLWDLNMDLLELLIAWLDIDVTLYPTEHFTPPSDSSCDWDWRYRIRPRQPIADPTFACPRYYQPFGARHGFVPDLSILDLIFNMGPEAPLILQRSIV